MAKQGDTMRRHVLFTAAVLLLGASTVLADIGPSFGTPNFSRTSPGGNAFFALSLAAMLIFGGYWVIRNPWAGLVTFCLGGGIVLVLMGVLCLLLFAIGGEFFLCVSPFFLGGGAFLAYWGGRRILVGWAPFVGVNLLFLLLSLGGALATIVAVEQLTWTNPRQEQRERRQLRRQQEEEKPAQEKGPSPTPSQDQGQ
jgi:hypothetical protein